jgi:hypothetical protein
MGGQIKDRSRRDVPDRGYHPLLDLVMPAVILVTSVAYAWSLRDIVDPELNLLFLRPVFAILWALLLIVGARDVWPILSAWLAGDLRRAPSPIPWHQRFRPGTEGGAGLVVAATLVYAVVALQGDVIFIASTCAYLAGASYLVGERRPLALLAQAGLGTAGIYLVMGVILGVRF